MLFNRNYFYFGLLLLQKNYRKTKISGSLIITHLLFVFCAFLFVCFEECSTTFKSKIMLSLCIITFNYLTT